MTNRRPNPVAAPTPARAPTVSPGFTLLEMVVAIAIFAVIAAISYSALDNFLQAKAHIDQENDQAKALQTTFMLLEQDLRYAVNRPVRNGYGDVEPAFIGAAGSGLAAGELQRVAWRLNNGELSRVTWQVLDRDVDSAERERRLLEAVEDIAFTFYSYDSDQKLSTANEWTSDAALPVGVEVTVLLQGRPAYRRVFELAGG